jgi:peptidoglycan/LPS O-acetylase OafA/YrhL
MKKKTVSVGAVATATSATVSESSSSLSWPSLTGLRGLAALWVFVLHAYASAGTPESVPKVFAWLFQMGWAGVDIFFTLSAFLLTISFAKSLRDTKTLPANRPYFLRRFARILPAHYLQCVILAAIFYFGFSKAVFWYEPTALGWLAHSVFWINAIPLVPAYVSPWWTLPVELGFYLLLPLLAKCLTDQRWWWLLIGIALSLAYRYVLLHLGLSRAEEIFWVDHIPGRLFQFLIGMLAAFFWVKWRAANTLPTMRARNILFLLASLGLLALPALGWVQGAAYNGSPNAHPLLIFWHLFASLLIAIALIMLASGDSFFARALHIAPLQWLGKISYGFYLWHFPVMLVLRENIGGMATVKTDFLNYFLLSFLISITLAFLSWYWLEAPILRLVSSKASRREFSEH